MRKRLASWKGSFLSLGGRLTLVNSVLTALPTYWMSIFRLPAWVIKKIDQLRRDFLWTGPDIDNLACRLVSWKNLCRPRDHGGWGILDLQTFNHALLGKWWWKFIAKDNWWLSEVIRFNYSLAHWDLFPRRIGRMSFIWRGVISCVPILRACISHEIRIGQKTLFWKDPWLNDITPRYIWPELFCNSPHQNASVCDLAHLLTTRPFTEWAEGYSSRVMLRNSGEGIRDTKSWNLTRNGTFSVKSLHNFMIDGGLGCPVSRFFWKSRCPKKINLFNWLVWKNWIPSLENLEKRRCNRLPTATCVLCHKDVKSVDHLVISCPYVSPIWDYFCRLLHLPDPP